MIEYWQVCELFANKLEWRSALVEWRSASSARLGTALANDKPYKDCSPNEKKCKWLIEERQLFTASCPLLIQPIAFVFFYIDAYWLSKILNGRRA